MCVTLQGKLRAEANVRATGSLCIACDCLLAFDELARCCRCCMIAFMRSCSDILMPCAWPKLQLKGRGQSSPQRLQAAGSEHLSSLNGHTKKVPDVPRIPINFALKMLLGYSCTARECSQPQQLKQVPTFSWADV